MKTPEQIAEDIADARYIGTYTNSRDIGGAGFRRAIALAAITADRAQAVIPGGPEQIAESLMGDALDDTTESILSAFDLKQAMTAAVTAGITAAWSSWEPETAQHVTEELPEGLEDVQSLVSTLDGVTVVQIDTTKGRIRVNLNDAPIWDGDPNQDERPGSHFPEDSEPVEETTVRGIDAKGETWRDRGDKYAVVYKVSSLTIDAQLTRGIYGDGVERRTEPVVVDECERCGAIVRLANVAKHERACKATS